MWQYTPTDPAVRSDPEIPVGESQDQAGADRQTIQDLQDQAGADRQTIQDLQDQAGVDRALIAELLAQGEIDRTEIANLTKALETGRQIGTAMGVIMASEKVTVADAFALLRKESQTANRKLRDVAEDVVLTGTLPNKNK